MANNSEDLKKIIVAIHKDGVGYKKIDKTLKLSCSMVAKTGPALWGAKGVMPPPEIICAPQFS